MFFPFSSSRPNGRWNQTDPVRLPLHLCLNWHPGCPVPPLIKPHTPYSLLLFSLISIAPTFHQFRFEHHGTVVDDKVGEQGEKWERQGLHGRVMLLGERDVVAAADLGDERTGRRLPIRPRTTACPSVTWTSPHIAWGQLFDLEDHNNLIVWVIYFTYIRESSEY